jgi:hypothetical protein
MCPGPVGYFGGLAVAVAVGLIEPPLALFIAAVPVFKSLTNTALPKVVRVVGEVLEGAAKPVGSDAEGVIELKDQQQSGTKVVTVAPNPTRRRASKVTPRRAASRATQ